MCGRFVLTTPAEALRRIFGFIEQPNLPPRYNIAPTQDVPVIRQRREPAGQRTLQMLRWGLVPSWAESLAGGAKMINARAETVMRKPGLTLGYREVEITSACVLGETGVKARGHEFHYSALVPRGPLHRACALTDARGAPRGPDGLIAGNTVALYTHLHFASQPLLAKALMTAAFANRRQT